MNRSQIEELCVLCPRCETNRYLPYNWRNTATVEAIADYEEELAAMHGRRNADDHSPWQGRWPHYPALSRVDNDTYICSPCGSDEAMRDFYKMPPVPPDEWPTTREAA